MILFFLLHFAIFSFQGLDNQSFKDFASIDLSSNDYTFKLLGDLEGTSMILKIKNKNGKTVGVFKPTSGSTNHRGEFAMYKLGSLIGLNIFPKVRIEKIPYRRLSEIRKLLLDIKFKKFYGKRFVRHMKAKEQHRKEMIDSLSLLIYKKQPLVGALKIWVKKLIFSETLGSLSSFVKHPVFFAITTFNPLKDATLRFRQITKIMSPKGTYYWSAKLKELSSDFSTMLVLDAIFGNRDRFPGGNVHFAPKDLKTFKYDESKSKINMGESKLISIDNGAVLKTRNEALRILKKIKIKRFDKEKISLLRKFFRNNIKDIRSTLELNENEAKQVILNASKVFNYIDSLFLKYENKIYL